MQPLRRVLPQASTKTSLRSLLTIPFVLQIGLTVGLVGWLSYRSGQEAVNQVAAKLRAEISDRIHNKLDSYLAIPHQINQSNLRAFQLGLLDLKDLQKLDNFKKVESYFWKQVKVFNVGYVNFGNAQGEYVGAGYEKGTLIVGGNSLATPKGVSYSYLTDDQGNRTSLLYSLPNNYPTMAPWYTEAVRAKKPTWTDIYQWTDLPDTLSISCSYPVYDRAQHLTGVFGVDLILSDISTFLQGIKTSRSGKTFIVERNGLLVASSVRESPFALVNGEARRISAIQSREPLIKGTAQQIAKQFGNFARIQKRQLLEFEWQGQRQFVEITPWRDFYGLDWLIVVVIPESDFMEQIYANTLQTAILCGSALLLSMAIGILLTRWISRPIVKLDQASQALAMSAQKQFTDAKEAQYGKAQGIIELENLAGSFSSMVTQLKQSFTALRIAEENYRSIFENALEGIFQSSPDGHFIRVNPAMAKIYGYNSPKDMMDCITNIQNQLYVYPEDRVKLQQLLEQQGVVKEFEHQAYRQDGTIIWVQIDARTVYSDDEKVLFYEGIVQDISDRVRLEAERQREEEYLKRQIEDLRIEIDHQKRALEVSQITESGYFQELQKEIADVNLDEFWR